MRGMANNTSDGRKHVEQIAYNLAQAAEAAGVSEPIMRQLVRMDGFPAIKVGRRWIIPAASLVAWLNEQAGSRACFDGVSE